MFALYVLFMILCVIAVVGVGGLVLWVLISSLFCDDNLEAHTTSAQLRESIQGYNRSENLFIQQ